MLRTILFLGFLMVASAAVVAVDFNAKRAAALKSGGANAEFSLADYGQAVRGLFRSARSDLGLTNTAKYMPSPVGWTKRDITENDRKRLFGSDSVPPKVAATYRNHGNDPLIKLAKAMDSHGATNNITLYEQGKSVVAIEIKFLPTNVFEGDEGKALKLVYTLGRMELSKKAQIFANVSGLAFEILPEPKIPAREMRAYLGNGIVVSVYADATDAEVFDVIRGLRVSALNEQQAEPDAMVDVSKPTTLLVNPKLSAVPITPDLSAMKPDTADHELEGTDQDGPGFFGKVLGKFTGQGDATHTASADSAPTLSKTVSCAVVGGAKRCKISYE